jgi:hypothetical protein
MEPTAFALFDTYTPDLLIGKIEAESANEAIAIGRKQFRQVSPIVREWNEEIDAPAMKRREETQAKMREYEASAGRQKKAAPRRGLRTPYNMATR